MEIKNSFIASLPKIILLPGSYFYMLNLGQSI
jgi:hypothetical protein